MSQARAPAFYALPSAMRDAGIENGQGGFFPAIFLRLVGVVASRVPAVPIHKKLAAA